jgi:predicted Zn-dependent protease
VAAVRRTEREADRLSVWLLANAGHDPEAAPRMIRRLGPHSLFVTASPTHGKASTRAREMLAEIADLRAAPDQDWSRRFVREP